MASKGLQPVGERVIVAGIYNGQVLEVSEQRGEMLILYDGWTRSSAQWYPAEKVSSVNAIGRRVRRASTAAPVVSPAPPRAPARQASPVLPRKLVAPSAGVKRGRLLQKVKAAELEATATKGSSPSSTPSPSSSSASSPPVRSAIRRRISSQQREESSSSSSSSSSSASGSGSDSSSSSSSNEDEGKHREVDDEEGGFDDVASISSRSSAPSPPHAHTTMQSELEEEEEEGEDSNTTPSAKRACTSDDGHAGSHVSCGGSASHHSAGRLSSPHPLGDQLICNGIDSMLYDENDDEGMEYAQPLAEMDERYEAPRSPTPTVHLIISLPGKAAGTPAVQRQGSLTPNNNKQPQAAQLKGEVGGGGGEGASASRRGPPRSPHSASHVGGAGAITSASQQGTSSAARGRGVGRSERPTGPTEHLIVPTASTDTTTTAASSGAWHASKAASKGGIKWLPPPPLPNTSPSREDTLTSPGRGRGSTGLGVTLHLAPRASPSVNVALTDVEIASFIFSAWLTEHAPTRARLLAVLLFAPHPLHVVEACLVPSASLKYEHIPQLQPLEATCSSAARMDLVRRITAMSTLRGQGEEEEGAGVEPLADRLPFQAFPQPVMSAFSLVCIRSVLTKNAKGEALATAATLFLPFLSRIFPFEPCVGEGNVHLRKEGEEERAFLACGMSVWRGMIRSGIWSDWTALSHPTPAAAAELMHARVREVRAVLAGLEVESATPAAPRPGASSSSGGSVPSPLIRRAQRELDARVAAAACGGLDTLASRPLESGGAEEGEDVLHLLVKEFTSALAPVEYETILRAFLLESLVELQEELSSELAFLVETGVPFGERCQGKVQEEFRRTLRFFDDWSLLHKRAAARSLLSAPGGKLVWLTPRLADWLKAFDAPQG